MSTPPHRPIRPLHSSPKKSSNSIHSSNRSDWFPQSSDTEVVCTKGDDGEVTLYLMRRSLKVLRRFHWMILRGRFNQLSHVSSPLLSKPGRKAKIPSVGVFDEVFLALGWHLEGIHARGDGYRHDKADAVVIIHSGDGVRDLVTASGRDEEMLFWLLRDEHAKRCSYFGSLDVLQGFSFFLQMGFTLILATLDGLDVCFVCDVIGEVGIVMMMVEMYL
ncbi:hypothetical protein Tco_0753250 [Tanacetum coccineum]